MFANFQANIGTCLAGTGCWETLWYGHSRGLQELIHTLSFCISKKPQSNYQGPNKDHTPSPEGSERLQVIPPKIS